MDLGPGAKDELGDLGEAHRAQPLRSATRAPSPADPPGCLGGRQPLVLGVHNHSSGLLLIFSPST